MLKSISVTEIQQFKRCRRSWYYSFVEGIRANVTNPNFFLGSAVHFALEAYYKENTKNITTLFKAYNEYVKHNGTDGLKDTIDLGANMLTTYWYYDQNQPTWKIISVEEKLQVPILEPKLYENVPVGEGTLLTFIADLIIEDEGGDLWIVDHKTAAQLRSNYGLSVDYQMTAYCYGVYRKLGRMPKGVIYNVLIKQLKEAPVTLKNGELSKNKTQKVTPEVYTHYVKKQGLNLADYEDIIQTLAEKSPAVVRFVSPRNEHELQLFEKYLYLEHNDMQYAAQDFDYSYPNPSTFLCGNCEYLQLCKETNIGGSIEFLKETSYTKKEAKDNGTDFE